MGRPNTTLRVSDADHEQLRAMVRSHSMPHSLVRRAQIVLLSGEGKSNREVARRCGVTAPAVSHWRRRYQERGLAGLHDELRPGRPRTHDDERVAELIRLVSQRKPEHDTPLESALGGPSQRHFQKHGRPLFRAVWSSAASLQELQAFH